MFASIKVNRPDKVVETWIANGKNWRVLQCWVGNGYREFTQYELAHGIWV